MLKINYFYPSPKKITHFLNVAPLIKRYLKCELPVPINPKTMEPLDPEALAAIFPRASIAQEMSMQEEIKIPDQVLDFYSTYRPTPLIRARSLEKALDTPAQIYFKNEGATPSGSHKLNTAIVQAYYAKQSGIKCLTTETGAGQWGTALSIACQYFGLKAKIFMVRVSYLQKPYRQVFMRLFGSEVYPSPSDQTEFGKKLLAKDKNHKGVLGIAISEAIECVNKDPNTKYAIGSVLNHVLMHQTIVGLEAKAQLAELGVFPDIVIGVIGGGSNFAGIAFPFLEEKFKGEKIEFILAEPSACPKLTKGEYRLDYGDTAETTPLVKMYTLGHDFIPEGIHAGGLRYHGAAPLVSLLYKHKIFEAVAYDQDKIFQAGQLFARTQGIIPAPESAHAIKAVIDKALLAKKNHTKPVILFNLSGHGYFDMQAYADFLDKKF